MSNLTNEAKIQYIQCSKKELNLDTVLLNGQSFRWKKCENHFIGVALNRVWRCWRENDNQIGFQVLSKFNHNHSNGDDSNDFKDYFQLTVNIEELYKEWKQMDKYFSSILESKVEAQFEGIRILKQPLLETIFAFICSSNNNITRISKMVNTLALLYGDKTTIKEQDSSDGDYYNFPKLDQMISGLETMESTLKSNGFGYRAKYVFNTVKKLSLMDMDFDEYEKKLKNMSYIEAKNEIQKLDGVGPKVADCICLMALNHHHVVPIDTHVFQITVNNYLPDLKKHKSVNDTIYKKIGNFYYERFGDYAGWAQSVLFSSRLKRFNEPSEASDKEEIVSTKQKRVETFIKEEVVSLQKKKK